MKLIYCDKCHDFFNLSSKLGKTKFCRCRKSAGKYLSDAVVAVVTDNCTIVGIDNNSFGVAKQWQHDANEKHPDWPRQDYFFTGWIPTKPGEVHTVKTTKEVKEYEFEVESKTVFSTMPISS